MRKCVASYLMGAALCKFEKGGGGHTLRSIDFIRTYLPFVSGTMNNFE